MGRARPPGRDAPQRVRQPFGVRSLETNGVKIRYFRLKAELRTKPQPVGSSAFRRSSSFKAASALALSSRHSSLETAFLPGRAAWHPWRTWAKQIARTQRRRRSWHPHVVESARSLYAPIAYEQGVAAGEKICEETRIRALICAGALPLYIWREEGQRNGGSSGKMIVGKMISQDRIQLDNRNPDRQIRGALPLYLCGEEGQGNGDRGIRGGKTVFSGRAGRLPGVPGAPISTTFQGGGGGEDSRDWRGKGQIAGRGGPAHTTPVAGAPISTTFQRGWRW